MKAESEARESQQRGRRVKTTGISRRGETRRGSAQRGPRRDRRTDRRQARRAERHGRGPSRWRAVASREWRMSDGDGIVVGACAQPAQRSGGRGVSEWWVFAVSEWPSRSRERERKKKGLAGWRPPANFHGQQHRASSVARWLALLADTHSGQRPATAHQARHHGGEREHRRAAGRQPRHGIGRGRARGWRGKREKADFLT